MSRLGVLLALLTCCRCGARPALAHAGATAAPLLPYPSSSEPTSSVFVYDQSGLDEGSSLTLETLGGGLARTSPRLFRVGSYSNPNDSDVLWLGRLVKVCTVCPQLLFALN